jgi:small subunit ribosomal protein S14
MAKKSSIEKNNRRRKLVKQYAGQARALKAIAQRRDLPMEERFRRALKLAELPRNSSPTRIRNRCEVTGRPRAYYRKLKMSPHRAARARLQGPDPRPREVELVRRREDMR